MVTRAAEAGRVLDRETGIKLMQDLLRRMVERNGSDLFITAGFPPAIKVDGNAETFNLTARNFTNALGFTTGYNIYVSDVTYSGNVTVEVT